MDNDDYCDDASNAEIERKEKMWLSCSERDRCIECEKSRKQGALDFGEQILKRISFLKLSPAENNLVFIEQGIKDYIKVLKEEKQ